MKSLALPLSLFQIPEEGNKGALKFRKQYNVIIMRSGFRISKLNLSLGSASDQVPLTNELFTHFSEGRREHGASQGLCSCPSSGGASTGEWPLCQRWPESEWDNSGFVFFSEEST